MTDGLLLSILISPWMWSCQTWSAGIVFTCLGAIILTFLERIRQNVKEGLVLVLAVHLVTWGSELMQV